MFVCQLNYQQPTISLFHIMGILLCNMWPKESNCTAKLSYFVFMEGERLLLNYEKYPFDGASHLCDATSNFLNCIRHLNMSVGIKLLNYPYT